MARPIKITQECIDECRVEFEKVLNKAKVADGKISFTKTLTYINRKAKVYFTELAWMKMITLIEGFSKEVAWHATAYRADGDGDNYVIGDILVYPQKVTAATVDMDEVEYAKWLMENCEDERFYDIHAQMHSHVNMGVTPSGTDIGHQEEILRQLPEDGFYIFMIWNKSHSVNIKIYDLQKNIMFESSDVTWCVIDGDYGLQKFLAESKDIVKDYVYTPSYMNNTGYNNGYPTNSGNGVSQKPASNNSTGSNTQSSLPPAGDTQNGNGIVNLTNKKEKKRTKFQKGNGIEKEENEIPECDLPDDPTFFDKDGNPIDMNDAFGYNEGPLYTG